MPYLVEPALPAGAMRSHVQPRLSAGDLTLRPWEVGDSGVARAAFSDPDIQRWHARRLDSAEEAHAWTTGWATRWTAETDASWAVVGADDRPVGQVGLRSVSLFEASAEVSYWVLPAVRGRGIAVRAMGVMTLWTFEVLGLRRPVLEHSTGNRASCRVAENAGFTVEGTLRSARRHADGPHDMHLHARLTEPR